MPGKVRSPSFPFVSLPEALDRARQLHEVEQKNLVSPAVAASHWGYGSRSSGGNQTIAALRAYGLLEDVHGALRLTDRAHHILIREPGTAGRSDLIRQAALSPPVFFKLWERYKAGPPSDRALRSYLVLDLKFNENAVEDVLRNYRQTLAFAELLPGTWEEDSPPSGPGWAPVDAAPRELTLSFPLGEFRAVRRIRPEEEESFRLLFSLWLEQIKERPGS